MTGEVDATSTIAASTDPVDAALRIERLQLYHGNLRSAVAGQGLMAAFLVVVMWGHVANGRLLGWLACLGLALLARWRASSPRQQAKSRGGGAQAALRRVRATLLALGLIWGSAGVLLFPPDQAQHQVFLGFLLAGMAAGTLTLTAFDAATAIAFAVFAVVPMALRLLAAGGAEKAAMAGMVLLFVTFLVMTARRAQRYVLDTVALRDAEAKRADVLLRNQVRLQQLSDALREKTDALQLTLDSMAQGILSLGADRRTNFYNQRLLQLLDLPASFMAARPTMDEISSYQVEQGHFGPALGLVDETARPLLAEWISGREQPAFPPVYFRRTSTGQTLEVKSRYLPDGGLVRTFSDVTPYFDAQQQLRDSEAHARKLALVAAHTDNAVTITDAERRIEWVNEGFTRLTGYRFDEVVGRRKADFLRGPATDDAEIERLEAKLTLEGGAAGEVLHRTRDGRDYWFFVETRAILDDDGRLSHYISIGRDVSERKAAELALRAARDEAQQASQAKSEFLSAMSHELRTPLNAILGFGQLLASDPAFVLPPRQQGQVREILRAGSHLLALINDVLDLARVEAGKQPIVVEPLPVLALIDDCLALMRPVAQERDIALDAAPEADCAGFVAADRTRLMQVLLNLVSNAIKYNHRGGQVLLSCHSEQATVLLSVRDSGPGLAPAQRDRLFNAFDRLGAEAGPIPGAGIGLVLSKRMVELMHGEIGVHSEPGQGSRFWVRLPKAQPPAPRATTEPGSAKAAAEPSPTGPTSTVLYIEDNPVNLLLMEAMLENEPGVRLITAQDPVLGLRLARAERPQLILLDIQLPRISGFEVLRQLRASEATRATPVVAISANAMPSDIQQGLDAGFDAYLTKPLELTELRTTVRRALRRALHHPAAAGSAP